MKKFKEHLQEKVTSKFGGIYEPKGIKDIKTYENSRKFAEKNQIIFN